MTLISRDNNYLLTDTNRAPSTQASGRAVFEMASASSSGTTELLTKVNGEITKLTAKANSYMLTVMFTKDIGQMTRLMAEALITM